MPSSLQQEQQNDLYPGYVPEQDNYADDTMTAEEIDAALRSSIPEYESLAAPQNDVVPGNSLHSDILASQQEVFREQTALLRQQAQNQQAEVQRQASEQQRLAAQAAAEVRRREYVDAVTHFAPAGQSMTADELAQMNVAPDVQRVLQHYAQDAARQMWAQNITPALQMTREQQFELEQRLHETASRPVTLSTDDRIRQVHPDADALNNDPAWAAFLNTQTEFGVTNRQVLTMAYKENNPTPTIAAISRFKENRQVRQQNTRPVAGGGHTAHSAPTPSSRGDKRRPISYLEQKRDQYRNGKITQDAFRAIQSQYENWDAQGLVDHNR